MHIIFNFCLACCYEIGVDANHIAVWNMYWHAQATEPEQTAVQHIRRTVLALVWVVCNKLALTWYSVATGAEANHTNSILVYLLLKGVCFKMKQSVRIVYR